MNARSLLFVCAIALFPITAAAQTGAISGTVTRSDTGTPLAGVPVQVTNGTATTSATTSAAGAYTIAGLAPGTWFALTEGASGFVGEIYDNIPCPAFCFVFTAPEIGTPIAVTAGATAAGRDFALAPGGSIGGRVTDKAGMPLGGIFVGVYNSIGAYVATSTPTDSGSGEYRIPIGLPSGTYFAQTSNLDGYVNEIYAAIPCPRDCDQPEEVGTPIVVTAPALTAGVDFKLGLGAALAGTITAEDTGAPLRGVSVYARNGAGDTLTITSTDASGRYLLGGLPAGTYYLSTFNEDGYLNELYDNVVCPGGCPTVAGGTPVVAGAGQTVTGKDFALTRGGRISGTIVAAGTSAPVTASVRIYSATGAEVSTASTNTTGAYATDTGLRAGTYYAVTDNNKGYIDEIYDDIPCEDRCDGPDAVARGTPIVVAAGATVTGRDFRLSRAGAIAGKVTSASTGAGVRRVKVRAYGRAAAFGSAETDLNGDYAIVGLPAGPYVLLIENAFERQFIPEIYDNIPCFVECSEETARLTGAVVTVALDTTASGIDFALESGGGMLGTVVDAATGTPLAGVAVHVASQSADAIASAAADVTDASGVFSLAGLPAGAYYVFTRNSAGFIDEAFGNIPCLGECPAVAVLGAPVAIAADTQTTAVDFALEAGGRISGVVTDAGTGAAVPGAGVAIVEAGGRMVDFVRTGANGAYLTPGGLAAGTYYVSVRGEQGYRGQAYGNVPCPGECTPSAAVALGTPIVVDARATAGARNVVLERGARIAGLVSEAGSGLAVPTESVRFYDRDGRLAAIASVNSSGQYVTEQGLAAGSVLRPHGVGDARERDLRRHPVSRGLRRVTRAGRYADRDRGRRADGDPRLRALAAGRRAGGADPRQVLRRSAGDPRRVGRAGHRRRRDRVSARGRPRAGHHRGEPAVRSAVACARGRAGRAILPSRQGRQRIGHRALVGGGAAGDWRRRRAARAAAVRAGVDGGLAADHDVGRSGERRRPHALCRGGRHGGGRGEHRGHPGHVARLHLRPGARRLLFPARARRQRDGRERTIERGDDRRGRRSLAAGRAGAGWRGRRRIDGDAHLDRAGRTGCGVHPRSGLGAGPVEPRGGARRGGDDGQLPGHSAGHVLRASARGERAGPRRRVRRGDHRRRMRPRRCAARQAARLRRSAGRARCARAGGRRFAPQAIPGTGSDLCLRRECAACRHERSESGLPERALASPAYRAAKRRGPWRHRELKMQKRVRNLTVARSPNHCRDSGG